MEAIGNNEPARPSRAYWQCQGAGWGLYAVATAVQLIAAKLTLARAVIEPTFAASLGVMLTHLLRRFIRQRGWLGLRAPSVVSRIILASMILATLQVAPLALVEMGYYGDRPESPTLLVVFSIVRWTIVFFVWQSLYCGFALLAQRRAAELDRLRLEQAVHGAELRALKSQLNPHFLFNSLNSVRALIAEDAAHAQAAVTQLANLLRYVLGASQEELVSVDRELQVVEDYLALESLRLGERLVVERSISDDARHARLPIMLLQTLVENAIKHGIAQCPEGGCLRIAVYRDADVLALTVENPRPPPDVRAASGTGIGLANATNRLRLLWGSKASLDLDLSRALHATARARIPQ